MATDPNRRTAACPLDFRTYDKLQALAKRKGMNVSKLLKFLIVEILNQDDADQQPKHFTGSTS